MQNQLPSDTGLGRLFLQIYLPTVVVFLLLAGLFLYYSWSQNIEKLSHEEQNSLLIASRELERSLLRRAAELKTIRQLSSVAEFLEDPSRHNRNRAAADLAAYLRSSRIYDRITLFDRSGREWIKVVLTPRNADIEPHQELHNRSGTTYVQEAFNLSGDQIYLSPFNLDHDDNGAVEAPFKPVIRLAASVHDRHGDRRGLLMLHYLGSDLLSRIEVTPHHTSSRHYLLNSDGFWLDSPDSTDTWGFMLNQPNLTVARRHPAAWQRIAAAEQGYFRDRDGLWSFATARPPAQPAHRSAASATWKLVSHVPPATLDAAFREQIKPVAAVVLPGVLLLAGGAWQLARTRLARRQLELAAHEQLHQLDLLLNSTAEGIYAVDLEGTCTLANQACADLLGYSDPSELLQQQMHDLMHHTRPDGSPYPAADCRAHHAIVLGTLTTVEDELFWRRDGTPLQVSYTAQPIRDGERIVGMVCVFRDIAERLKTEQERLQLATILEESLNEVYLFSTDTLRFTYANRAALQNLGYRLDELSQLSAFSIKPQISETTFRHKLEPLINGSSRKLEFQTIHQRKDGSSYPVEVHLQLLHVDTQLQYLAIIFDISERLTLEEQLRHAQKLESIGQLSSGIAHDFNNILQIISGNTQMLQLRNNSTGAAQPAQLLDIMTAVERGTRLTGSMLAFARRQSMSLRQVELNHLLQETEQLASRLLQQQHRLVLSLHPDPLQISADPTLLQQVLFNLVTNARDAMPDGGIITISTGICDYSREDRQQNGLGEPGRYAQLKVRDTGQGISDDIRRRIFEPFFTTKEVGSGTGLGLSMIYGTIKQHNGFILLETQPGAGSCFTVFLPLAPAVDDSL